MVALAALALAGCSAVPDLDPVATGSIGAAAASAEPAPKGIAPDDWQSARSALVEALSEARAAPSVPWENHARATRGTVTPLASSDAGAKSCRGFLMSFVREAGEDWVEGEACRTAKGAWTIAEARRLERG